jgi:hypothetical protein
MYRLLLQNMFRGLWVLMFAMVIECFADGIEKMFYYIHMSTRNFLYVAILGDDRHFCTCSYYQCFLKTGATIL